jgi:hypothetical protein
MTNYLCANELEQLFSIAIEMDNFNVTTFLLTHGAYRTKLTFRDLPKELRNNQKSILIVVRNDGDILYYVSKELRNNKEFMLKVVQCNGRALKYASDELRNDYDVVLAAVISDGEALVYALAELYNNRNIVLAAVQNNGNILGFASKKMWNDKEIVLAAIRNNSNALNNASPELLDDIEVILTAVRCGYYYHKHNCKLSVPWPMRLTHPSTLIHQEDLMRTMWNLIHTNKNPIETMRHIMQSKDNHRLCNCPLKKIYNDPKLLYAFTSFHGGNPILIDNLIASVCNH